MRLDLAVLRTLVAYGRPIVRGELPLDACDRVLTEKRWIRASEIVRGEETFLDTGAFFARGREEGWVSTLSTALALELWLETEVEAFLSSLARRPDAVSPAAAFDLFLRSTGRRPKGAAPETSVAEATELLEDVLEALVALGERTSLGGWERGFAETLALLEAGAASDWDALPLGAPAEVSPDGQTFDVYAGGVYAGRAAMVIPGRHNVRNALAAIAAAAQGYGAKLSTLFAGLASFKGIRRRQDLLYEVRGVRVYDDFAHHPTAVDETLRAMRSKHPKGTMWAVFEPRSATACRALHQHEYARAFGVADRIVFAPLGRSEIAAGERLDLDALVADLTVSGKKADAAPSVQAIIDLISKEATSGDTVVLMSNGAFGGIYDKLRDALSSKAH